MFSQKTRWPLIACAAVAASGILFARFTPSLLAQAPAGPGAVQPGHQNAAPEQKKDKLPAPGEFQPFTQKVEGTAASFEMVPIPGGKFKMGSPKDEEDRDKSEGPQFEVEVEPFYMGKFEVTWELYNEYLNRYPKLTESSQQPLPFNAQADAISYPTPIYDLEAGPALQRMGGREGRLPAVIMSHWAAKQFTKWLSAKTGRFYRLPTEAEWEYAARAGTDTAFFFGNDVDKLDEYAWYFDNAELPDGENGYREVGKKKPNPWGLHDIYGNVAEIVADQFDDEWYAKFEGKTVSWRDAVRWPTDQYPRIARGGGFESDPEMCRSAAREKVTVSSNSRDPQIPKSPYWWTEGFSIGMRIVSPVKEPTAEEKAKFWNVDNPQVEEILKRDREQREMFEKVAKEGGAK